jgi:Protein of unknown function (DUF1592)/Protein of unknown function (DUF1588)/Protein of unknown function (DUF1595)/Protein of unknown function (DUF1587)
LCAGSLALATGLAACEGSIGGEGSGSGNEAPRPSTETLNEISETGMRRLTAAEFDASVRDLVGVIVESELALPEDLRTPFDNDYTKQQVSEALITAADSLAGEIAADVVADPGLRDAIMPCTPSGASDEACYREFVADFGRQAFRRPLTDGEVDRFATFMTHAQDAGDFWLAIDSALRAFFEHPAFLYRVELGIPVEDEDNVFRLTDFELATRLSYVLLGTTPPVWLLDEAEAGSLSGEAGVRAAAQQLLSDDRAQAQVERFHAMWMSYEKIPLSADLADAMQAETGALLERVIFEQNSGWVDVLRSTETFVTTELATHYGLTAPSGPEGWVGYADSGRQGLLSQGSFLSAVAKFDDTSPVQRGLLIRARLFCQDISPPPPDLMVDVDMPPEGPDPNACKIEKYNMWQTDGCKLCHALLEPTGFGLENYDSAGRYREFEPDRPDCPIDGEGTLEGVGSFTGPAELANLMIQDGGVDECVATQFLRYTIGRYELSDYEYNLIERVVPAAQGGGELKFMDLMLEMVSGEPFRHRREEVAQ